MNRTPLSIPEIAIIGGTRAALGAGIALLPEWLVRRDLERGALRALLREWSAAPIRVVLLHRRELRGALRVRAFVDHLRSVCTA